MPNILVEPNGTIMMIYRDDMRSLLHEGQATIKRVSAVEPTTSGHWTADLSPVHGPILGSFETRQAALDAEVAWLNANML